MNMMEQNTQDTLWKVICHEVQPYHMTPYLTQMKIISDDQYEHLISMKLPEEQMAMIVKIVQTKGIQGSECFLQALMAFSPRYDHIIARMKCSADAVLTSNVNKRSNIRSEALRTDFMNVVKENMHVQKRWRSLANRLSMTREANAIQKEANIYMHSPSEIVINLLEQFKDIQGKNSTCGHLYDALRAENFNEVCDELACKFNIS